MAGRGIVDLSVLGGFVTVNTNRTRLPNGQLTGPVIVSIFGIPVYVGQHTSKPPRPEVPAPVPAFELPAPAPTQLSGPKPGKKPKVTPETTTLEESTVVTATSVEADLPKIEQKREKIPSPPVSVIPTTIDGRKKDEPVDHHQKLQDIIKSKLEALEEPPKKRSSDRAELLAMMAALNKKLTEQNESIKQLKEFTEKQELKLSNIKPTAIITTTRMLNQSPYSPKSSSTSSIPREDIIDFERAAQMMRDRREGFRRGINSS